MQNTIDKNIHCRKNVIKNVKCNNKISLKMYDKNSIENEKTKTTSNFLNMKFLFIREKIINITIPNVYKHNIFLLSPNSCKV